MDSLLRRWQQGWGLCRGLASATDYASTTTVRASAAVALDVHLGLPERDRELFALADDRDLVAELVTEVVGSSAPTWLTVTTQEPDAVAGWLEEAGLRLFAERKLLMSRTLPDHPGQAPPPQYVLESSSDGPLERVRVLDRSGVEAARGMAAITGADTVMHDIHTDPDHRRRGLGSVVMSALAHRATERGATTGLLMATTEGAYLYANLGWLPEATMITATTPLPVPA
ncbi:FR47-like protein [Kribbella amoyensis]|uniref:FR47-like protein n=1 Tax=Kribbella amoyensis TaxID=996641 RepID=A0A561BRG9_9ACTN|nr:GNAT family N-acetyltransferase [Kribbella amoyensis]TWD81353.1 FR47-like protein [Kribbella amoyensis]